MSTYVGYAIFYKDKDGFELPLTEYGEFVVYPNETKAKPALERLKTTLSDLLNPRITYRTVRKGFFKKEVEEIKPPYMPQWQRENLELQLKTIFIKRVGVV